MAVRLDRQGRVNIVLCWLGWLFLRCMGWRAEGKAPPYPKFVVIFAHHTSSWDIPIAIAMSFVVRVKGNILIKDTAFVGPLGWILRKCGGIPVDRTKPGGLVQQVLQEFESRPQMVLAIAPEGTRKLREHWKSGFYRMAVAARVPIALAYFDYERKVCGVEDGFLPSGDVHEDMARIRSFYANRPALHPERVGPVRLREEEQGGETS